MAWAAGTLAIGFSAVLMLFAFVSIAVLLAQQLDITVRTQSVADTALGARALSAVVEHVHELAQHSMVVNGLIDSSGRQSYLVPFMEQDGLRSRFDATVTVCDPAGDIVVSVGQVAGPGLCAVIPVDAARQAPSLDRVEVEQEQGDLMLHVRAPIYMEATRSVEGQVLVRASVRRILEVAGVWKSATLLAVELDGVRQDTGRPTEGPAWASFRIDVAAPVAARVGGREIVLRVFHAVPLTPLYSSAGKMALLFLVILFALIFAVSYLARRQAARLTVPLGLLTEATTRTGRGDPFEVSPVLARGDEIGVLAGAVKSMADALQGQETALREAQRIAGVGSWEHTLSSGCFTWSDSLQRILGREGYLEAPSMSALSGFYTPESWERLSVALSTAIVTGAPYELDLAMVRADGSVCWTTTRGEAVRGRDGAIVTLRGTVHDITERKEAEEQIRGALTEKEALLKEIYHRVKNNLQLVSSLLNLQSRRLPEGEARRLLDDSANRVKSMALVHEQLYRANNLSSISLASYLRQLTDNLISVNYPLSTRVKLRLEVEDVVAGIESAIPFGLVVNELVSNAYRHGYPAEAAGGEIVVRVTSLPGEQICLEVEDDGRGLPADFDPVNGGSLGMQLVVTLAQQLGGELTWATAHPGALFVLQFSPRPLKIQEVG